MNRAAVQFFAAALSAFAPPALHANPASMSRTHSTLSVAPQASSQQVSLSPLIRSGPSRVASGEYRLEAKVDAEILKDQFTEIWAKAYWPEDIATRGPRPLIVLLHGNRSTCETRSGQRFDSDCQYTTTGTCPKDMVVTPHHLGFEYIGDHMASHGYVVISVNASRGITCGFGNSDDPALVVARGRLVLKHLALWHEWTKSGDTPKSLGVPERTFLNAIDFSNVGLFGHSRGGEGVRIAYNLLKDPKSPWAARISGITIRGIFEVGATDGILGKTFDAVGVAWNQLLPLCDGDVVSLAGRGPFERMMKQNLEMDPTPKSLYMAWGTNHNFFNSEWRDNDALGCENHELIFANSDRESIKQRTIGLAAVSDFFRAFVGAQKVPHLARHFNPAYKLPKVVSDITKVDRDMTISTAAAFSKRIEDFERPTGINSSGERNDAVGIKIQHLSDEQTRTTYAEVSWDAASANTYFQSNWTPNRKARSLEGFATLDFRISRANDPRNSTPQTDFSVQLVHSDNSISAPARALQFGTIRGPVHSKLLYQTVRIPLIAFTGARLNDVRGVRFVFDRSARGAVLFANVRASSLLNLDGIADGPPQRIQEAPKGTVRDAWSSVRVLPRESNTQNSVRESRAFVMGARFRRHSPQLDGSSAVELSLLSLERFPVIDELPVLKIGDREFYAVRFDKGSTRKLIVSIPADEWSRLQSGASMRLQFGSRRIFKLSDFNRSWLR